MKTFWLIIALLVRAAVPHCAAQDGAPITLILSPEVCISGSPVEISGNTIIGKEVLDVSIVVTTPAGAAVSLTATTDKKGAYKITYDKAFATGQYIVTATPADGKNTATDTFTVATISGAMSSIQTEMFQASQFVQQTLDAVLQILEQMPQSADIDQQIVKLKVYKGKIPGLKKDDEELVKRLKDLVKETTDIPQAANYTRAYLDKIRDVNNEFLRQLPALETKVEHFKNASQTCEMINNMIEACGAISFVLDFKGKGLAIVKNLASDKVIPGMLDRYFEGKTGSDEKKETKKLAINTMQKGLLSYAGGTADRLGFLQQGLSLDICSYVGKILYAQTCKELKGKVSTTFKAVFKADNGAPYAVYDLDLKGEMKLRYKAGTDLSKGAEVTGEVTGYRVRYGFEEDFENVERVPAGLLVLARQAIHPIPADLNYFNNDLGAVFMAGVPGSFRVAVKGKIIGDKLTLEVIDSPFDKTETEETNKIFLVMTQPLLPVPIIRYFPVPIAKSKVIWIVALMGGHEYKINKDGEKVTITETGLQGVREPSAGVKVSTKTNLSLTN